MGRSEISVSVRSSVFPCGLSLAGICVLRIAESLIDVAHKNHDFTEVGLFVYRNNIPAYRCYRSVGFEVQDYPDGAPYPELCYYLTRPIA